MGNYAYFYTVGFYTKDNALTDRSVLGFFEKLRKLLVNRDKNIVRIMDSGTYRFFSYYEDFLQHDELIVIPFGRLIDKNRPYAEDEKDPGKLVELKSNMYHINTLIYNKKYNLAMYTTNQNGPSYLELCTYLTSYLPEDDVIFIMRPIFYSRELEDIKKSPKVSSITVSVDLGGDINDYFRGQVSIASKSLVKTAKNLFETSKEDVGGKALSFTISIGNGKKEEMLDKNSIVNLVEMMNLDSRHIKEIKCNYFNTNLNRMDEAKFIKKDIMLKGRFSTSDTTLAPEFLLNNSDDVFKKARSGFFDELQNLEMIAKKEVGDDYNLKVNIGG